MMDTMDVTAPDPCPCGFQICDCNAPVAAPDEDEAHSIDYWEQGGTFAYEAERARREER